MKYLTEVEGAKACPNTVNSLYSGHCWDLKLVSSVARVRNSGSFFQSNVCNLFLPEFICCPYFWGVRYSGVSARRELTVVIFSSHGCMVLESISLSFDKMQVKLFPNIMSILQCI